MVAKTVASVLFDAYDNHRIWRLSRRMIEFIQKLLPKSVPESNRNVKEFGYILNLTSEANFWWFSNVGVLAASDKINRTCRGQRIVAD